jgi:anti-sigma B factor antagonist
MSDLSIITREIDGVDVLDLNGDIALGKSSAGLDTVLRGLVKEGKRRIVLNLANVRRIDSSGLGTLVAGHATVEKSGGRLKLTNISDRVIELLTMTRLHVVFDIFENKDDAIRSFDQASELVTGPLDQGVLIMDVANSSLQ